MMDLPEGTSVFLEQLESKKNSLRKAILMIAVESKELDEHLDLTKESFNECAADLDLKNKNLECHQNSIAESNRELVAVRDSLETRLKEIECREDKFYSFQQSQLEAIKMQEGQLAEIRMWVVEKLEELEFKEESLSEQKKLMEVLLEKFQVEKQGFEDIQKSVSQNLNEICLKEKNVAGRSKELNLVQDWIERRAKELDSKEEKVEMREQKLRDMQILNEERCQELCKTAQELDFARQMIEERSEKLDSKENQLNSVQKYIRKSFYDFHAKSKQLKIVQNLLEKQLEDQSNFFKHKSKDLEVQLNDFESKQKSLEEQCKHFEAKEKQLTELLKDFGLKEKQPEVQPKEIKLEGKQLDNVVNSQVKFGQVKDAPALDLPAEVVSMNGRRLQLYLNEHFEDLESLSSEVFQILQLSLNPPELVLDAMEGFYPPHLKKGEVQFETAVVKGSCILLLEQLMILCPPIWPNVQERALALAVDWKVKMDVLPRNPLDVLAFILFLASYNLASNFDANEILHLLWFIPLCKRVPELCSSLGLQKKVPDFVKRLVERRLHLEAIEYVYLFDLEDEFPPTTLLESYISYEEEAAGKILKEGHYSIRARDTACRKELNALEAVMGSVKLHKLESQFPLRNIKERTEQLERRRIHLETLSSFPSLMARLEEGGVKKRKGLFPEYIQHPPSVSPFESPLNLTPMGEYCSAVSTSVSPEMSQYPFGFCGGDNFGSLSNFNVSSQRWRP